MVHLSGSCTALEIKQQTGQESGLQGGQREQGSADRERLLSGRQQALAR